MRRRIEVTDVVEVFLAYPFSPGAGIIALLRTWLRRRQPFSEAIEEASAAMERAATLTAELSGALVSQQQKLNALRQDYERYQALADTTKQQASAFLAELDRQLRRRTGRERGWAFGINLLAGAVFFIIGVAFGDTIKRLLGL